MFSFEIDVIVLIGYDGWFVLLLSLLDSKFAVGGGFEENFGRGGSCVFHLRWGTIFPESHHPVQIIFSGAGVGYEMFKLGDVTVHKLFALGSLHEENIEEIILFAKVLFCVNQCPNILTNWAEWLFGKERAKKCETPGTHWLVDGDFLWPRGHTSQASLAGFQYGLLGGQALEAARRDLGTLHTFVVGS